MKTKYGIVTLILVILLVGCASSPSTSSFMGLNKALDTAVQEIEAKLPTGTEIIVYKISSFTDEIGEYLCNELNSRFSAHGRLTPLSREVAIRHSDANAMFLNTGLVTYAEMRDIGRNQNVHVVISGGFDQYADFSQLRIRVVDVNNMELVASYSAQINNKDQTLADIMAPFGNSSNFDISKKALAHLNRGKDLMVLNNGFWDEAILEFDRAIDINRNLAEAYLLRGQAYSGYFRLNSQAIADFTQVIRLEPNNARAYFERGWAYSEKNNHDKAIADFTKTIDLDLNNTFYFHRPDIIYAFRSNSYVANGDYDSAIADYNQMLKLDSINFYTYNKRGKAYFAKGDYDKAISDYTQAIQLCSDFTEAYINRGNAHTAKGDHDNAIADWEAILYAFSNYPGTWQGAEELRLKIEEARQIQGK